MSRRSAQTQGLHRHSRNAIGVAVVCMVCSFGGLTWTSATLGAWLRDPLYADKEVELVRRASSLGAPATTFVMFGSSRTANALHGGEFEARWREATGRPVVAFNFGVPSCGPITQLLHLRRLLDAKFRPSVVLIEVMPPLMAGQVPIPPENHFHAPERLLPGEVDFVVGHGYPAEPTRGRASVADWWPIYGLRLPMLGRVFPAWSPWHLRFDSSRNADGSGWLKPVFENLTTEQRRCGIERAQAEYADLLRLLSLDGPAARAITESVKHCRDFGIPVALVVMPEGRHFRALYSEKAERALAEFIAKHTAVVTVIDARLWLDDDAFSDGHHMLATGAKAFTRLLAAHLLALGITSLS